ncbi:PfkB family carbohydrate kinase [Nocardia terpenica]|uniref:Carbohydrate kinase PfkB domain-containing protein n=1 Tax=Nocardia terpenica TaxID=455432 RepID=A0A164LTA6_9NOCA|nr:PfkB family carbohydrate kinase [Nocardia terpenica]KZM72725.1 hypothetical protein AWN90_28515 [Nocardia terpenica]NQE92372.1 hypothetical protein [Nocardia terpenica]
MGQQDAVIAVRAVLVRLGKRSGLSPTRLASTEIDATPLLNLPVVRRHVCRSGRPPEETAVVVIRALVHRLPPTERIIADAVLALGTLDEAGSPAADVDFHRLYAAELGERREYLSRCWQALHTVVSARPPAAAPTVRQLRVRLEHSAYTELARLLVDASDDPALQPETTTAPPESTDRRAVTVVGDAVTEHLYRVDRPPLPGTTVRGSTSEHFGGKGLGRAVAIARLGLTVRLLCAIGDDPAGQRLLAYLRAHRVDTTLVKVVPGAATPADARILTGPGEASEIHCSADRTSLTVADLRTTQIRRALTGAAAVLATLEQPAPVVEAVLAALDTQPERPWLILHAAPAIPEPQGLYRYLWTVDYLIGTEHELRALVPGADTDTADTVLYLRMLGARAVCVLGDDRCRITTDDLDLDIPLSPAFLHAGPGAHAAFAAALTHRLLDAHRPAAESDFRWAAAAMVAAQSLDGTPDAMPSLDRIDRILELGAQYSSA